MQSERKPLVVLAAPRKRRRNAVHELAVDLALLADELRAELLLILLVLALAAVVVWTWPS